MADNDLDDERKQDDPGLAAQRRAKAATGKQLIRRSSRDSKPRAPQDYALIDQAGGMQSSSGRSGGKAQKATSRPLLQPRLCMQSGM